MFFKTINPYSGNEINKYKYCSENEINESICKVHNEFLTWKKTDYSKRATIIKNVGKVLEKNKNEYARIMSTEMGKPISVSRGEVEKCAVLCSYYAEHGEGFLKAETIKTEASNSFISFEPLGVIFAVMPWNFPFWQVFRYAVPALLAGNGCLLKHAPNVPECALAIERIFIEAGAPENIFKNIFVDIPLIETVISHPNIKGVTLTGSERAGSSVASLAGKYLKKTVMELGGSDPYIILDDADMNLAVDTCVTSRLINSGQTCISAKRFIVVKSRLEEFTKLFVQKMSEINFGDPMDEKTQYGPMARRDLSDNLNRQVEESIKLGANCLLKGEIPSKNPAGTYYPVVVLSDVKEGMPAYDEELFGPVSVIYSAEDEEDAIRIANDTPYGLGAAVFTKDIEKGTRIATKELNAGLCFVNDFVKSDPRLPFGGINRSGYGTELSTYGIKEFVNIKTVSVK